MKRYLLTVFVILLCHAVTFANHITGGTIFYTYLGTDSDGKHMYRVTLKLYRDANSSGAQLDGSAAISIFSKADNSSVFFQSVPKKETVNLFLTSPNPCISNPPIIQYEVGVYEFTVSLPASSAGYTIAYQRCCRIGGINNLVNSNSIGSTYTAEIPGNAFLAGAHINNSAMFVGADTVVVCANNQFCYNFGALDPDPTDQLSYSFCTAYTGGSSGSPMPSPPAAPPYTGVAYAAPFNSASPMGPGVTLDPNTGMMCGIAPAAGIYCVTVCVTETRDGKLIATQRKDLQIKIGDCNIVKAILPASIPICDDFTRQFSNDAPPNNLIHSYYWEFPTQTSSQANPVYTFPDTGKYTIKLVLNRGEACADSAISQVSVYPGFFPGFTIKGVCVGKPTEFTDTTKTVYGFVNSWRWDFGDVTTTSDTSRIQNPTYTYGSTGTKSVQLIVGSNKGCLDTLIKDVVIMDKPPLSVAFKDTLICNGDQLQLHAVGQGSFSWTPTATITQNANTPDPTVQPTNTTKYIVKLDDNGCIAFDTVQVRVVNFVTLQAMADTVICATDSVRLRITTDGLQFSWTPTAGFADPTVRNPTVKPAATTTYTVTSIIGHCNATDDVTVTLVPYPIANAGLDDTICFRGSAQLNATIVGSTFTWSPSGSLSGANTLTPIARPVGTTSYILSVFDTQGCPKPGKDTVVVNVLPQVIAFAGNDTSVVVGQPLQFNGSGGVSYEWSPAVGLNQTNISNPKGLYDGSFDSIIYKLIVKDLADCADSDYIRVKIFKTQPQVFVPDAFTPNGDGKNDVFRPIAVGLTEIEFFRVFNRWGELVFSTTRNEQGWDGKIRGTPQGSGVYVWVVQGTDFTGKKVFAKGTVTLIR